MGLMWSESSEPVPSLATENSICKLLHEESFYFFPILWEKKSVAFLCCKKGTIELSFLHASVTSCVIFIRDKLFFAFSAL